MPVLVISLREISTAFNLQFLYVEPDNMPVETRSVTYFLWPKNLTATEISREIDKVYEHGASRLRTVQRLVACFAAGEEGLEGRPRSHVPPTNIRQEIDT
jgi:hypothetical protein